MKKDLARGWTAWHEKWAEEARRKRMLAAAATRLSKPGLSRSFVHWQQDWEYAEAVKEAEAKKERARIAREKMAAMDGFAAELQASIEREKAESAWRDEIAALLRAQGLGAAELVAERRAQNERLFVMRFGRGE